MNLKAGALIGLICVAHAAVACRDDAKSADGDAAGGSESSGGDPAQGSAGERGGSESGEGGAGAALGGITEGGSHDPGTGASIPMGSVPWPADGGAPTAYELLLPKGCDVFPLPPRWLDAPHSKVLGRCHAAISSIPLDGSAPTTVADVTGAVTIVAADAARVIFTEAEFLRSATVDGADVITLASDVKRAEASPDLAHVVYAAPDSETGTLALYSVASEGGEPAQLSDSPEIDVYATEANWWFTADSKMVWFTSREPNQLVVVGLEDGEGIEQGSAPYPEEQKVWSKDGRKIAFTVSYPQPAVIRVLSADQTEGIDLVAPEGVKPDRVSISPAGDQVWFTGVRGDQQLVMAADVADGEWRELAGYDDLIALGIVGADQDQLLLTARNGTASPVLLEVPLSGGTPSNLGTLSSLCDFRYLPDQIQPGLSSDRRQLAFKNSVGALVLADLDEAKAEVIIDSVAALKRSDLCDGAIMSPNSERIALLSCVLGGCRAVVVDTAGEFLATDPEAGSVGFSFSPDSSLLAHHNLYSVRVLSIDDNEVKYTYNNSGGTQPIPVWIDGRRVVTPAPYDTQSVQQIVYIP
jgi:hypothetical protein